MANTSTSVVTFSILSPDASLSYDHIKLRLEEYRALLASDSDTIELSTENGKTVICRKEAKEMEEYLDQAEILLRDIVQSRDISTLVVLHHLRDLAEVLDNLKLYDECRLTGNCALDLAEALCRRSLEFRQEQAEALAHIAGLSVYRPRARTLFIQAVSICEEVVENDASHSNKVKFLHVLGRAGSWATDSLGVQWLGRAIQLMTTELPPTLVPPDSRGMIYFNYGNGLTLLKQYANATEAYHESISIRRILVNNNPAKYNYLLARTLVNMGAVLDDLGKYGDAIAAHKEVLDICTTMSAQDPFRYNILAANALFNYGKTLHDLGKYEDAIAAYKEVLDICSAMSAQDPLQYNILEANAVFNHGNTLCNLNQFSEAAVLQRQAISLYRNLAQTGHEWTLSLCSALHNYGAICYLLGEHAEAVLAYQESILLRRARAATEPEERALRDALHDIANSFNALGNCVEANSAAIEALERNHGSAFEYWCKSAPDFKSCFVCQRATTRAQKEGQDPKAD